MITIERREHDKVIVLAYSEYVTNRAHYTIGIGLVYWVIGNTIRRCNIVVVLLLKYLNNMLIVTKSEAPVWFVLTTTNNIRICQEQYCTEVLEDRTRRLLEQRS